MSKPKAHKVGRVLLATIFYSAVAIGARALWGLPDAQSGVPVLRLALLSTPANGPQTFLHVFEVGRSFPPPVAKFSHLPDATVKGAVLTDGAVLATADYDPGPDRSFGSALFRVQAGEKSRILCDRIAYASRPFVTPSGNVFVQRGTAGTIWLDMRVDHLSIDKIDPKTGATQVVWEDTGYVAHLAGAHGRNLVLYHVQPTGARLILVDQETGAEAVVLPSMPPFATDFSTTEDGKLVFQNRHESRADVWVVERLDLASGNLEVIREAPVVLAPKAWPQGELSYGYLGGDPDHMSLATGLVDRKPPVAPEVVEIRAFARNGALAAALAFRPGISAPDVVLLKSNGAVAGRLQTPPNTRLQVAGFLP